MPREKIVFIVVVILGLLAFTIVVGGIYLTSIDKSLPGELIAIGSAAAGAVGGILAKTSSDPVVQVDSATNVGPNQ